MKTFIKWFLQTNIFHVCLILVCFIIMLFWQDPIDKALGMFSFGIVFIVLLIGKYLYYKKNQTYIDEEFK
jgi:hypothetical protein